MFMRKRFQKGSLRKVDGSWIAQWWEDGHRRKRTLGRCSEMTKAQAQVELTAILAPINASTVTPSATSKFGDFVKQTYLPFYRRKWKRSTAATNEDRLRVHLISEFTERTLGSFTRDELQDFLDHKAARGLSYSVVAHLRWDLRQILGMAVAEGFIHRNPAELLFVPRSARQPQRSVMTFEEVKKCFAVLDARASLIVKLAVLAGMRPGEIFALRCGQLRKIYADIQQRVYRGDLDSPKTNHSVRKAALPAGVLADIHAWIESLPDNGDDSWVFPSETMRTPVLKDNLWRRDIAPKLKQIGLE
jgi:integrase